MADTLIALDGLHAFDVTQDLTTQIPFDHEIVFRDVRCNRVELFFSQRVSPCVRIDSGLFHKLLRTKGTDPVHISECVLDLLIIGYIDS